MIKITRVTMDDLPAVVQIERAGFSPAGRHLKNGLVS